MPLTPPTNQQRLILRDINLNNLMCRDATRWSCKQNHLWLLHYWKLLIISEIMFLSHLHDKPRNHLRNLKNVEPSHARLYGSPIVANYKEQYSFLCICIIFYPLSHQRFRLIKRETFWQWAKLILDKTWSDNISSLSREMPKYKHSKKLCSTNPFESENKILWRQ